jgi:hypothetical protein
MDNETRALLEDCATQFQYYTDLHNSNGSYASKLKAKVNQDWVDRIRKHLDGTA